MDPKGNRPTPCSGRPIRTERPDTPLRPLKAEPVRISPPWRGPEVARNLAHVHLEHRNAMRMLCTFLHRQAHTRSP
jgi:hypothetical protein